MIKMIVNFSLFQVAWLAGIIGGANDWPLLGALPAIVVVAVHLLMNSDQLKREISLIFGITILGLIVEMSFVSLGTLHYTGTKIDAVLPPIWIVMLWFAFGTLPHGSLDWMSRRIWLQLFLGALFGPLSYFGGVRLGAATMSKPIMDSLIIISLGWAVAMVLMFQMAGRLSELE